MELYIYAVTGHRLTRLNGNKMRTITAANVWKSECLISSSFVVFMIFSLVGQKASLL